MNFNLSYQNLLDKGIINVFLAFFFSGLIFILNILLPIISTPEKIGSVIYLVATSNLIAVIGGFGYSALLVRNLNVVKPDQNFLNEAKFMILASFIVMTIIVFVLSIFKLLEINILTILIPLTYVIFISSFLKSVGRVELSTFIESFLRPISMPITVILISIFSFQNYTFMYALTAILIIFVSLIFLKQDPRFLFPSKIALPKKNNFINSFSLMATSFIFILFSQADIILVRNFLSEAEVSVFFLTTRISAIIFLVFISFKNKFLPQIAKLMDANKFMESKLIVRDFRQRAFYICIPLIAMILIGATILENYIYADDYSGLFVYVFTCSLIYIISSFLGAYEVFYIVSDSIRFLSLFYLVSLIIGVFSSISLYLLGFGFWSFLAGHCIAFLSSSIMIRLNLKLCINDN
tara:strand:- start:15199 stop:16422 length:1224 start_codon:yes stop_codon:yes gene_type:complete